MMPSRTLLVVEDDLDLRDTIAEALEVEGYTVMKALDGLDGIERLRAAVSPPDLILLDLMMPRMGGEEFFNYIKGVGGWQRIPVVILTADANGRATAKRLGSDAFLSKPVKLALLFQTIESELARSERA